MKNKMRPVHPGEVLQDELDCLELSASSFAKMLSVPTNRITSILNGTRAITADTALRFSRFFGTTAEFWIHLQAMYDLKVVEKKHGRQINKEVIPYSEAA